MFARLRRTTRLQQQPSGSVSGGAALWAFEDTLAPRGSCRITYWGLLAEEHSR